MKWLFWFLIYQVPWWVWAVLAVCLAVWVFTMIRFAVGPKTAAIIVLSGLGAATVALMLQRAAKGGYDARGTHEQEKANETLDHAHKARADAAARDADPGELRKTDGFKRPD